MAKAKIYLYKEGNECTSLTGGWGNDFDLTSDKSRENLVKNSNHMILRKTKQNGELRSGTSQKIDLSNMSKICCHLDVVTANNNTSVWHNFSIQTDKTITTTNVTKFDKSGKQIYEMEVDSYADSYYVKLSYADTSSNTSVTGSYMYNMYLETKENILTINSQENENITFNTSDLGLVTITKIDVLVNGVVSKTYTDEYSNLSYTVDKSLCYIGDNNIEIRVAYSQGDNITETVSEYLTYKYDVSQLPLETPLLDTVERVKLLTKSKQSEKTILSSILTSKNVEVSEEDKMSDLIYKVNEMDYSKMYLYKSGKKNIDFSYLNLSYYPQIGIYNENSDHIFLKVNVNQGLLFRTTSLVDTSQYSKLCFEYESSIPIENTYNAYSFGCSTNDTIASADIEYQSKKTENRRIYSFDLSTYNKLAYIFLKLECYAGDSVDVNIYNMWLEK